MLVRNLSRQFLKGLEKAARESLQEAAKHYREQLISAVDQPGPSRAGEPPGRQTGQGQRGIVQEVDAGKRAVAVGVNQEALHLYLLDQGTSAVARRPWLKTTLMKNQSSITSVLVDAARDRLSGG